MTAQARLVVISTAAALCWAAMVSFAWISRPGQSVSASTGDVAAAVVNINGDIPDGRISGTGMIISGDGLVLTNNHVVEGTVGLTAQVAGGGPVYQATVVGVDPTQDVAVVRMDGATGLPTVPLETSGVVNMGDQVTGMGNALGSNGAPVPASGVVTALNETLNVTSDDSASHTTLNGLIQFTARIQPGDSGGPLLNAAGRVIGMDTAGSVPGSVPADGSIGAAIPIDTAIAIAHQIIAGQTSPFIQSGHSGILGIEIADASRGGGAQVTAITPADAADSAGIVGGDVITALGGITVHSVADLRAATAGRRPGDRVAVTWRDGGGAVHTAVVALSAGPPA